MDGTLARSVGAGGTIEFDGKTLPVKSIGVREIGVVVNHLLRLKRAEKLRLVADVYSDFPPDVAREMLTDARREAESITEVSDEEIRRFIDSKDGLAMTIHQVLEKSYPGQYTFARVEAIVCDMADAQLAELLMARDQLAAIDKAGNSTGPLPVGEAGLIDDHPAGGK